MNDIPSPAHWQALEPLIDEALALPIDDREAFVDAACGGDEAMRDELSTMLAACERLANDDGFLARSAGERYASLWEDPASEGRLAADLAGLYVLEDEIGRGGNAVVYRARDVKHDRRVAFKVLRQTVGERSAKRFRREIEIARRLQHPNIVSMIDAGESAGRLWYTMPLVDGETLGARLRRVGRLEIPDVVRFMRAIADALSYAHDQGVIHRDLKPDNILLEGDRVIVADFGVAKALAAAQRDDAMDAVDEHGTTAGVRVGTPLYMAPEQIAGDSAIDHRVDLYALGVVGYQLICGSPPFGPASRQILITAHLTEVPPPIAPRRDGVPPALERLVLRLLSKRPIDRPTSAADVRAELDAMLPSIAVPAGVRRNLSEASMSDDSIGTRTGDKQSLDFDDIPTPDIVGGRYRVEQRIAAGGMATVFLAEDLKHGRRVAVKVLHEALAHSIGIQRFLREIEVVARLQHPHLLTLIDSGDVDGLPYYVMPYLEALSLRETITAQKQLSFSDAIRITQEITDGLAYAHRNGVVHRDIKPSNILMSGGHAVVADFGIATALQRAGADRLTGTGMSLGSPTYMSPEQAAGERDVDARSDIYSVACVLYEMLAGEPPIDSESMQQVVTRKLTGGFTPLHERRADVPASLEAAIHRALSADRNARFASIEEFSHAIALPEAAPTALRRAMWIGLAAGIVAVAGGGLWLRHERAIVRATQQVAVVKDRAIRGAWVSAFDLAQEILPVIPNDSTLLAIRPLFTDFLKITTMPAGARVSIRRIDQPDSAWRFVGVTPLDSLSVARTGQGSIYKIRIERAGFETRDVLANLFSDLSQLGGGRRPVDTLRLDSLGAHAGMVRIDGLTTSDRVKLPDYYIGKTEVTNRDYARFVSAGGYTKREYWAEPMERDGRPVAWEQAMTEFRDRSGSPGPSTWINGTYPSGQENFPVGGVSYYEAAAYARFAGLRLPTSAHWRRAATIGFRELGWAYLPSSNLNGAQPRTVGQGAINPWGLYDVAGNVREWCVNPSGGGRLALGGGWEDAEWLVANTLWRSEFDRAPSNGFRLVALSEPESTIAALSGRVSREARRDFRGFKAVSDAEFAGFRRMFDYDRRPLDARVEAAGASDKLRWQRVSFTAAYGGERMSAYVYLPKNATGPFEPVIFWPPGPPNLLLPGFTTSILFEGLTGFLPQNGRALVLPVFKGTFERDSSRFTRAQMAVDTTASYRDLSVQWVNDMRRTIDYLETRSDMKMDRLGYYGVSWGGQTAPLALAIEPRIKAAVLHTGGYAIERPTRPEVDAGNYTPRVHTPILMLSGAHDNAIFPYETSQAPFFQQLGTRPADKKRVAYSASHLLPQEEVIRETLAWFDRYLSGKVSPPTATPDRP